MKNSIVLLFAVLGLSANAYVIKNTDLIGQNCIVIESDDLDPNAPIDYETRNCRGLKIYDLQIKGGDLRYDVNLLVNLVNSDSLLKPTGTILTNITKVPHGFKDIGKDSAIWVFDNNASVQPKALVFEIAAGHGYDLETDTIFNIPKVHVVKLMGTTSCTVQVVSGENKNSEGYKQASDKATELAKEIAASVEDYECMDRQEQALQ